MVARDSGMDGVARPRVGEAVEGVEASRMAASGAIVVNIIVFDGRYDVICKWV
jgi:hypothetical protein